MFLRKYIYNRKKVEKSFRFDFGWLTILLNSFVRDKK